MSRPAAGRPDWLVGGLVGMVGIALAALVIRPFEASTIDPDAAASVLYFERLVAGRRLEAFLPSTPKPLLTFVYGLTWTVVHDWRALTLATIAVFGLAVGLAGAWLFRLGGSVVEGAGRQRLAALAAGSFAVIGLITSADLLREVAAANSLVWAIAGWLVAAHALTGRRVRPRLAGLALLAAGLARFETLALVGAAGLILLARTAAAVRGSARPVPRGSWLVLAGGLALPIAGLHDQLLTGDPFFWLGVPARYTALYLPGAEALAPLDYGRILVGRYLPDWPLVALAGLGLAVLARSRRRSALTGLAGLAGLGAGVILLLFGLAARATYISNRYYEPLDLVLLAAASIGVGWLTSLAVRSRRTRAGRVGWPGPALALAAPAVLALALAWPPVPIEPTFESTLELGRSSSANLAVDLPRLAQLAGGPAAGDSPSGPVGAPTADPGRVALFVPSLLRPRIAVETGVSLDRLGDTYAAFQARPAWPGLHVGQWIYHDRAADRPNALDRALERVPALLGRATARVEFADDARGVRILRVVSP